MLADQDGLEAFFHQLLAGPRDRVDTGIEGCGDLAVAPCLARSELSAFNRMRAVVSCRAGCLPAWISVLSRSRSASLSFTTYFFTAIRFAVTKHLRRSGTIDSEIDREINDEGY
jgi:hypothetical protein